MRQIKLLAVIGLMIFTFPGLAAAAPGFTTMIGEDAWNTELTEVSSGIYSYAGSFSSAAGSIKGFHLTVDADPWIAFGMTATNFSNVPQQFGFVFLPGVVLSPPLTGNTVIDASIAGGLTDNNGDGVRIAPVLPFDKIQVNVTDAVTAKQFIWGVGPADSKGGPAGAYEYVGETMATAAGPLAPVMFGEMVQFTLSPHDTASLTGYCAINDEIQRRVAAPIPGSLLLLGSGILGLVGVGWRRRRI